VGGAQKRKTKIGDESCAEQRWISLCNLAEHCSREMPVVHEEGGFQP
jgi:hypothetical protein